MKTKYKIILFIILIVELLGTWVTNAQDTIKDEKYNTFGINLTPIEKIDINTLISDKPHNTFVYDDNGILSTNWKFSEYAIVYNVKIKQSDKKYTTNFKIIHNGKSYYISGLILKGDDKLRFLEFDRKGNFKNYCFRFGTFEIYKSK